MTAPLLLRRSLHAGVAAADATTRGHDGLTRGLASCGRYARAQQLDGEYQISEKAGAAAKAVGHAASQGFDTLLGWMSKPEDKMPARR